MPEGMILLMEDILHQCIGSLSQYLVVEDFSAINSKNEWMLRISVLGETALGGLDARYGMESRLPNRVFQAVFFRQKSLHIGEAKLPESSQLNMDASLENHLLFFFGGRFSSGFSLMVVFATCHVNFRWPLGCRLNTWAHS